MSIQSEIDRISGYRDDSYDAVEDMGGTLPQSATMANLPTAIRSIPQGGGTPYDSNPAMDGTASPGVSDAYARGDHVHPADTSRQAKIAASGILKGDGAGNVSAATAGTDYVPPSDYAPEAKTAAMTQPVGKDASGKLWTEPGGVTDVQVNGTSVVQGGVANVPMASASTPGVVISGVVTVTGTTPTINAQPGVRYVCGEVATLDITLPASGVVDVTFESGSTPTVLTITPPTGLTLKWANDFDPTSLEANTTYELNIMDGIGVAVGVSA